jgi:hypothetical protein
MTRITDKSKITKINISNQGLRQLPDLSEYTNLFYLNCSNNELTSLQGIPSSVKLLNCANNQITSLNYLPHSIKWLCCQNNYIVQLDNLPIRLNYLNCSNNLITSLDYLPPYLNSLKCSDNYLKTLDYLPKRLTVLNCSSNELYSLDKIPNSIKFLYCGSNNIRLLNFLPPNLEILHCKDTYIQRLDYLPTSVYNLDCDIHKMIYAFQEYCPFLTYFTPNNTQYVQVSEEFIKPKNIHKLNNFKKQIFKNKFGWKLEKYYLSHKMNRINKFKEELMMTIWHPRNIHRFSHWGEDSFIDNDL